MTRSSLSPVAQARLAAGRAARRAALLLALAALATALATTGCSGGDGSGANGEGGLIVGTARLLRALPDPAGGDGVELVESGDPLFGARVYLGGTDRVARTDSSGRFRFDAVPPGDYELQFERDGYEGALRPARGVAAGKTTDVGVAELVEKARSADLDINLATIFGEAMRSDGEPGKPSGGGVEVTVVGGGATTLALTENDGTFLVEELKPGRYRLYFRSLEPGYAVATRAVEILPGANRLDGAVALAREGSAGSGPPPTAIRDQMVSEDGKQNLFGSIALAGPEAARLAAYASAVLTLDSATPRIAGAGPDGSFTFSDLEPGRYNLALESDKMRFVEAVAFEIAPGSNTLLVVAAQLIGEAAGEGADAAPIEEAPPEATGGVSVVGRLRLANPDAMPSALAALGGTAFTAKPSRDGSFRIDGAPPGTYDFFASARGHLEYAQAVELPQADFVYDLGEIALELDVDRPKVIASDPAAGARGVFVDEVVSLLFEFDQPMDAASAKAAFSIKPDVDHALYMGRESSLSSDRVLHVELYGANAASPLQHDERYAATIAASAASVEGATMERPFALDFRTAKPSIVDTYPAKGSNDGQLSANQHLLVYCNAPIDARGLTERVVSIRPDNGGSAAIVRVATDANTGWGILEISYPFEEDTNYTVRIDSRLKTSTGKGFANTPYEFSFRTGKLGVKTLDEVLTSGRRVRRSDEGKFRPRYR